ncbi:hypothetical protein P43SY_009767 [Pythium insidiosum]|uniref:EML-like first beta-propeller domain-containing protein n=1 Tax=Pythium insidiosum TaxID=114742 RepID=A0AAD5LQW7_PYTIN|nr:hypothetical protein P43SY_009767 [Pythium insidiosum]
MEHAEAYTESTDDDGLESTSLAAEEPSTPSDDPAHGDEGIGTDAPTSSTTAAPIGDPLLDVNAAYEAHELVRPLQRYEVSRDHLVFGDICGFDAGKRNVLHVLEERAEDGSHGGVVLTSAGNAVELLTLAPTLGGDENSASNLRAIATQIRSAGSAAAVIGRRYIFGMSGAGVGGLAVHPSRRFFAVAEKGVKPHICVYQYPAAQICRVLRNGTELAYSSVIFSEDGETLASVGSAPDFLLTVWNWREEQTILRCKAFGQDVFSVRFAPHDSGFLTTSGVGHIRFWKMASTFTGLKLQGDIGKFGKSELSDIEAFCVLPDKKVLSGTERGVLLLWDGNFIKCEIVTASRELPHRGGVRVVLYEPTAARIVTAGHDGSVIFWAFDAIDRADLPPEDNVAPVDTSGVFFATASDDATFFLFKVVQSSKVSKLTKYAPEYVPLGFQRTGSDGSDGIRALAWREDDQAILTTLRSGRVVEYSIPMDGSLERLAELKAATAVDEAEGDAANETYELKLSFREFTSLQRNCFMSTKELQALETLNPNGNPVVDEKIRDHRLDQDEWEIDLDYGEILAKQGEDACEEVRRELAYAVEREELLLLKMRETYVSPLARNMGDYKLKTAPNYVVPEEQRVNTAKKRRQMALLEEKMYEARLTFNVKVLELRELKLLLVQEMKLDEARIKALQRALVANGDGTMSNPQVTLNQLEMDLSEWPEQRERVSDADIEFSGSSQRPRNLDRDDNVVRIYLIKREIQQLLRKRRDEIRAFDDAVAHLRREKMRLDVVFKKCELRLFTLLSELVLLEQFESRENLLSSKLDKSKSEKAQIVAEINDIQENMNAKRKDMEEWGRQEKAVQAEFLALVNGAAGVSGGLGNAQHPNFAALQKIFKKKIKRPKKKGGPAGKDGKDGGGDGDGDPSNDRDNGDGDDEDDEEDEDDSDFDDDDDDDDDDDEEDVCPAGCDLQLYEKVLALREKRADVDDAMSDLNKALEELRKNNDRQVAKQRQIDKELQATEQDIQLFQSEKQMRFNQLDIVVALSKQQLRCLVTPTDGTPSSASSWQLPEQASNCLVFGLSSFEALAERIESLQRENKSLRQQFKDLHKQQSVLAREKNIQQQRIAQIQHKCEQLQLLKFGQLVDIELLDKACDTTRVAERQAKVRAREMDTERELVRVRQQHQQLQRRILDATEQNTALLGQLAALSERQLALERELNHANTSQSVLHDETEELEREMRERNKLVKVVKLQAREIDALKQEIGLLRGKDGKVYAPRT